MQVCRKARPGVQVCAARGFAGELAAAFTAAVERTLSDAHEKFYEQLSHPKARVDGSAAQEDVVDAVLAAAKALGAPLPPEPASRQATAGL